MKIYDQLDPRIYNRFLTDLFDLERTYVTKDIGKPDFYTIQSFLDSYASIIKASQKIKDEANKIGSLLLSSNLIYIDLVKNMEFAKEPSKSNIKEVKLNRDNPTIQLSSGEFNLSKIPYIGEQKTLATVNDIAKLGLSNLQLINNKLPNSLLFDLTDTKGNPVKISSVKLKEKKISESYNPLTLETKGILPLKIEELGKLDIEIESANPVKIQNLQLANINFNDIARSELESFSFSEPIRGINIVGSEEEYQAVLEKNFDLEINIIVGNRNFIFRNKKEIFFGVGNSVGTVEYLNLDFLVDSFQIGFKIYKKDNVAPESLIDFAKYDLSKVILEKEQVQNGYQVRDSIGPISLYELSEESYSERSPVTLGTATEIKLNNPLNYYKNNLRIKDKDSLYVLGSDISSTTFKIENEILYINSTNQKIGWLANNIFYEKENNKILARSDLELDKTILNNKYKIRKLEKTYYYKDFKKYNKNTVLIPAEVESEDVRIAINQTSFGYYTESTDTVGPNQFKKMGTNYEVYLDEYAQRFGVITVYGDELRWNKIPGEETLDGWLFDVPTTYVSTTVSGSTSLEAPIKGTVYIRGYEEVVNNEIARITNLTLKSFTSSNGSSVFEIPFTPYINLSVVSDTNYTVLSNYVYVASTNTSLSVSYFLPNHTEATSLFSLNKEDLHFYDEPSSPVTVNYLTVNGYLDYDVLTPVEFNFEDNNLTANNLRNSRYLLKYRKGNQGDIPINHPRKIIFEAIENNE